MCALYLCNKLSDKVFLASLSIVFEANEEKPHGEKPEEVSEIPGARVWPIRGGKV